MANHKSAIKRHRQSLKRRDNNRAAKSRIRSIVREVQEALKAGEKAEAKKLAVTAEKLIASAATKGTLNKSAARRHIGRISASVN